MQVTHGLDKAGSALSSRVVPMRPFPEPAAVDQRPSAVRLVKAKEHLFHEGDPRQGVFEVVSGAFALYTLLPDGRRQIARFALPGDFLCIGWERAEPVSAEATVDSFVKGQPMLLARRIAKDAPASLDWVGAQLAEEARAMQDLARLVALGGALERVAGFIGRLSHRIGKGQAPRSIALPMTRADIGDHLGLTLETVSRELSRLRRMKVIAIERVTTIVILDPERLRRMGGDLLN